MKRLIPLAVIACLAVAACGSSSKSSSSPTTAAPSSPGSSAPSGAPVTGNPSSSQTINESGSSLLYPYLQALVTPLKTQYSNINLAPAAGGSGKGISDVIAGTVQIGGSDAYLSSSQMTANPGLMNIPIVVSSQAVDYNLTGIKNLKLTGDVLAQMYQGKITTWNDPAIAALNPGVTLPSTAVVPVRRIDSSGDTFLFTSFLSATNSDWSNGPSFGTTVTWPSVSKEITAQGNPGMVQTCKSTPGCVAYIGISAQSSAVAAGLGESMLKNAAGAFVQPTATTVNAAVAAGTAKTIPPNLVISLIYQQGAESYPIANFEYIIVKASQSSANLALAIRSFFSFAISPTGGSAPSFLAKDQFQPLPSSMTSPVNTAIAKIQG